jgi:catechol 2,3-dioxygenase-like lactoylglutathione lyase family enzyme
MNGVQRATFVVREYDEAIDFFVSTLGFTLVEDVDQGAERRWVVVEKSGGASLVLGKAESAEQRSAIGNQAGGRVAFFLFTDDFRRDYSTFRERGVQFMEEPRNEPYGTVAVFRDLYGGLWDLIQPA